MAHSVAEAAARAVKNSQKVKVEERTSEQILKGIRGNLAAKLAVTPSDTAFLLGALDGANSKEAYLQVVIANLRGQIAELEIRAEAAEARIRELQSDERP